jgi:hypothetical protein
MRLSYTRQFILSAISAESPIRKSLAKLIKVAGQLGEQELRAHHGIHLHRIQNQFDPASGLQLESMEVTGAARIKCIVQNTTLVLLSLHTDHDATYGRK